MGATAPFYEVNMGYGYCPVCGGMGKSRERRIDGNDRCENGHIYPSKASVREQNEKEHTEVLITIEVIK